MKKKKPELRFKGFTDDWEQRKFGSFLNLRKETGNQADYLYDIELENLVTDMGIIEGDLSIRTQSNSIFRVGDTLFGRLRPYLNKWWLADREGVKSGEIWALYPNEKRAEKFAYYLVQSKSFLNEANLSSGTKMPRTDWIKVAEAMTQVPQIEEQELIGNCLYVLDCTITLHQ